MTLWPNPERWHYSLRRDDIFTAYCHYNQPKTQKPNGSESQETSSQERPYPDR